MLSLISLFLQVFFQIMIFLRILFIYFSFVFYNILFYFFGILLYSFNLKRIGHYFVAVSIAGDFGLCKRVRSWLASHCPGRCPEKCSLWTCSNYSKCKSMSDRGSNDIDCS